MDMLPEPSNPNPLHSFSLPHLKWGSQKLLKCIKLPPLKPKDHPKPETPTQEPDSAKPWNLRKRRAACAAPLDSAEEKRRSCNGSVSKAENFNGNVKHVIGNERFAIGLTKEEVEEDFVAMVGKKPPRRPKKRPRIVQKQLDSLFPGLWLSEVTPESYKVSEIPESGKGWSL